MKTTAYILVFISVLTYLVYGYDVGEEINELQAIYGENGELNLFTCRAQFFLAVLLFVMHVL